MGSIKVKERNKFFISLTTGSNKVTNLYRMRLVALMSAGYQTSRPELQIRKKNYFSAP